MKNVTRKSIASLLGITSAGTSFVPSAALAAEQATCRVTAPTDLQISTVLSNDVTVQAADAAVATATAMAATKKLAESKAYANYQKALRSVSKTDNAPALKAYQTARLARISADAAVVNAQARANSARQSVRDAINNQYLSLCSTVTAISIAVRTSSDQVNLAWNAISGATAYVVTRDGQQIATVSTTSFQDSAVNNGTTYGYTVTAIALIGADQNISLTQSQVSVTPVLPKPTNLQATQLNNRVSLTWNASAHATSYNIFRDGNLIKNVSGTSFVDTESLGGSYQVQAVEDSVTSAKSNTVTLNIVITVTQPTGLKATAGNKLVNLQWDEIDGATNYRIMRNGVPLTIVEDANYTDNAVTNGTTYFYRVIALNGSFESNPSSPVSATPIAPIVIPATPSGLVATAGNAQVALSWQTSAGATSYKVLRDGIQIASVSGTSYTDSSLVNGTTYTYTLKAGNSAGDSAASQGVSAKPVLPPAPSAPSNVVATPSDKQVVLTWPAVAGATSYQVFRDGNLVSSPALATFTDTALVNGTTYSYTVKAVNQGGSSVLSDAVTAKPMPPLPATPTNLSAIATNAQVSLTWNSVSGVLSYKVFRDGTQIANPVTNAYVDTSAVNGTTYSYTVKAVNGTGESTASSAVSATPVAPPSTPANLKAIAGNAQVALTWDVAATATTYKIYRDNVLLVSTQSTSYTDKSVTNGTTYLYTVKASNAGGDSSASSSASAKPQISAPLAPTGLTASPGNAKVTLNWTASATATSYSIYRDGNLLTTSMSTTYLDSSVVNGTQYVYTVTASNVGGESPASSSATATPALPPAPATPTGLSATAGNAQVSLSWSTVATATGYKVYRDGSLLASPTTNSFVDSTAVNGMTYSYTVSATNDGGESSQSSAKSAMPQMAAPNAPTNLLATAGNAQVSLTWSSVATATSYKILRNGVQVGTSNTASYTDTGLTNGTSYTYTVKATNAGGDSVASSSASATPVPPVSKLATPTGLTANTATSLNTGAFRLSWNAVSGATSYTIYKNGTLLGTSASTTYTPVSPGTGAKNSYTVMATNGTAASNSDQSAAISSGVFVGTAANDQSGRTVYGQIQVSLIVTGTSVTGCWATYPTSSDSGPINNNAIPQLCSQVLSKQPTSGNVSTITNISGATATSPAFRTSLQSALSQAGL